MHDTKLSQTPWHRGHEAKIDPAKYFNDDDCPCVATLRLTHQVQIFSMTLELAISCADPGLKLSSRPTVAWMWRWIRPLASQPILNSEKQRTRPRPLSMPTVHFSRRYNMERCSSLTVSGHEDFSHIRSLGHPGKALLDLSMTVMLPFGTLDLFVKNALEKGVTEDEIQDIVNFAWKAGYHDRAKELSMLVALHRQFALPQTCVIKLGDHETLLQDTAPNNTIDVPIVLLHALSMDASMWRAVLPTLSQKARILAYDIRGFGFARDAPPTTSVSQLANDLQTLLTHLNIKRADIYGISYGGVIAQTFALQHPKSTRSVAVLASSAKGSPTLHNHAARAEKNGMEAMVASSLTRWFSPEMIASNPWQVRYARTCVRRATTQSWATAWRIMGAIDIVKSLSNIKVPVLAVAGAKDVTNPPHLLQIIAQNTRGRYVEIEDGTHMLILEHADAVVGVLQNFRREVDRMAAGAAAGGLQTLSLQER